MRPLSLSAPAPHTPKDTQAHLPRLLGANYPSVVFEKDRGMFGGSAFLNPFPRAGTGFRVTRGAADTAPLFGCSGCRDTRISPYEPSAPAPLPRPRAAKPSRHRDYCWKPRESEERCQALAGLLPGGSGMHTPAGHTSPCSELPSPAGTKLSPSTHPLGNLFPLRQDPCDPAPAGSPSLAL